MTDRRDFYIYVLFREDGSPFYIGKGSDWRWNRHEYDALRTHKRGRRLAIIRDMQARGVEVPKVKLHEGLTETAAFEYEVALIAAIGRGRRGPLVNLTDGGEGPSGAELSGQHIAAIIAGNLGKKRLPVTCVRIGDAHRGKKIRLETREKIAYKLTGRKQTPQHVANMVATKVGKKRSPETCEKIRQALLGKKHTTERRANQSAAHLGKPLSVEHILARSAGYSAACEQRRSAQSSL